MVELKLGYGEQDREAPKMRALHSLFTQDPGVQPRCGIQNRYAMLKNILEQQGILSIEEYLTPSEQPQPPQPDPAAEIQPQMAQKQMELQERQIAVAEMKAQTDAQLAAAKIELAREKSAASHALHPDNMDLKEVQFDLKKRIDEGEFEILKYNSTEVRGIESPTG